MLLPGLLVILVFHYIPMYGIQIAFRKYSGGLDFAAGEWMGMTYLNKFFHSFQFESLIRNTLLVSLSTIVISFPVPILLALLFNRSRTKAENDANDGIPPPFISTVVLVSIMTLMLSSTGVFGNGRLSWDIGVIIAFKLFVPVSSRGGGMRDGTASFT